MGNTNAFPIQVVNSRISHSLEEKKRKRKRVLFCSFFRSHNTQHNTHLFQHCPFFIFLFISLLSSFSFFFLPFPNPIIALLWIESHQYFLSLFFFSLSPITLQAKRTSFWPTNRWIEVPVQWRGGCWGSGRTHERTNALVGERMWRRNLAWFLVLRRSFGPKLLLLLIHGREARVWSMERK